MESNRKPPEAIKLAAALGAVIRKNRLALGLSQEKLAELSGHHRTYIGFLERGELVPTVYNVSLVAKALNLSASQLISDAGW